MPKVYAIVLAGGVGNRMGVGLPKQFLTVNKRPIIVKTLEVFQKNNLIDHIIVVSHAEYIDRIEKYRSAYNLNKIVRVIPGGETRKDSSYNALVGFQYNDDDILLFHDAVRPFVDDRIIEETIEVVQKIGAADVCVPTTDTIVVKDSKEFISDIPDRKDLMNGQTPQGFKYGIIKAAHDKAREENFTNATDDVKLVLNNGNDVNIVNGSYNNIKITNAEDLVLAGAIDKNTGYIKAFDVKNFQLVSPGSFKLKEETKELVTDNFIAVRPTLTSVCQADLRYFAGKRSRETLKKKLPMALLHEGIGIVEEDNGAAHLSNGDRVIIIPNIPACIYDPETYNPLVSSCSFCGTDYLYENHCKFVRFLSSGFDGLSQNMVFHPVSCLLKIPDPVPNEVACMSELLTVSYNAVKRIEMKRNSHIAIFGDGPVGYFTALIIRYVFNFPEDHIHLIGLDNLDKFDFIHTLHFSDVEKAEFSPDYIFECVGGDASQDVINAAINLINPVGKIVLMGVSENKIALNTRDILEKGLTILGSSRSSRFDYVELISHLKNPILQEKVLRLILPNKFVVSDEKTLHAAFEYALNKKEWGKVLLKMDF